MKDNSMGLILLSVVILKKKSNNFNMNYSQFKARNNINSDVMLKHRPAKLSYHNK